MSKFVAIATICLLFLPLVSALTFEEDSKYTNGNLAYTFKKGVSLQDFELIAGGIIIDDIKLGVQLQGGMANIIIYDLRDGQEKIGIKTSAKQTLTFSALIDGKKQYFFDGESNYLDSYEMGNNEVLFTFNEVFDADSVDSDIDNLQDDEPKHWYEEKLFELEIYKERNEQGIIEGKNIGFSWLGLIVGFIVIIIILIGWNYAFR